MAQQAIPGQDNMFYFHSLCYDTEVLAHHRGDLEESSSTFCPRLRGREVASVLCTKRQERPSTRALPYYFSHISHYIYRSRIRLSTTHTSADHRGAYP